MKKEEKKVPDLRFKGFHDDWEQRKLGEVSDIIGGGTPSTKNPNYWGGDIDWYSPAELKSNIFVDDSQRKITELGLKNSSARILPKGTVLFTSRAGIGNTAILAKESATNQGFQSIVPKDNILDTYFIYSKSHLLKRYGEVQGAGSTFVEISGKEMARMPLLLPAIKEQIRIGTYLKNLDNIITLHQRKINILLSIKKAYLNAVFPLQGENTPRLRFNYFTEEWEQRKFKDFSDKSGKKNSKEKSFPAYSVSNKHGLMRQSNQFEDSRLESLEKSSYKIVYPNEFVYNPSRINVGSIGFNDLNIPLIVSSLYVIVKMKESIDNTYILQFMKSQVFNREVNKNTEGSVREYLFFENFKNIRFPYAKNIKEQQQVGLLLKNIDDTITLHQSKLESLTKLKQVYLNKMFI